MREEAPGHKVVRFLCQVQTVRVDATSDTHEHMLGTFDDLIVHTEKVGTLKSLETEVVIVKVTGIIDGGIKLLGIGLNELPDFIRDQSGWSSLLVMVVMQDAARLRERI